MAPKLTEADVLFELFLPVLCRTRAEALAHFKGTVQFHLRSEPPRVWNLTGGDEPWVQRGAVEGEPDLLVTVSEDLVNELVQGREPDLDAAITEGRLGIRGETQVLEAFELTMADATNVMELMKKG